MLQIGTRRNGRAGECWSLGHAYSDFWPRRDAWASLDIDDCIFPHREIDCDDHASIASLLAHCRNALCATFARAWSIAPDLATKQQLTARLKSLDVGDALLIGGGIGGDWYATPAGRPATDLSMSTLLDAITVLDDLHSRRLADDSVQHDSLVLTRTAFYAGFNPVVICTDAIGEAELLTVACWLGVVHRGRWAIMPRFVAAYWLMLIDDATDWPNASYLPDAFLFEQAAALFKFAPFRETLVQAISSGSLLVSAQRPVATRRSFVHATPILGAIATSAKSFLTPPTHSSRGEH